MESFDALLVDIFSKKNIIISSGVCLSYEAGTREPLNTNLLKEIYHSTGIISFSHSGAGFVKQSNYFGRDIYIPPGYSHNSVSGDLVHIEWFIDEYNRYTGSVIEVITRGYLEYTGIINIPFEGRCEFVPQDINKHSIKTYGHLFKLEPLGENQYTHETICRARVTKWPDTPNSKIHLKPIEICENPWLPENAAKSICIEFNIPTLFDDKILLNAEQLATEPIHQKEIDKRKDYRALPFITIDGLDSRDLDDAVFIQELSDEQGWQVMVAIADVAHYIQPGTLLDFEAFKRGTSVYFPDLCIPMLPESLSNGICSLNEGEDRLVVVCEMLISKSGQQLITSFQEGIIQSQKKTTYGMINKSLQSSTQNDLPIEIHEMVKQFNSCRNALHANRLSRGALEFDALPDTINDTFNKPNDLKHRGVAERIIEELMLAANESAAKFTMEYIGYAIFRTHPTPTLATIQQLTKTLEQIGLNKTQEPTSNIANHISDLIKLASHAKHKEILLNTIIRHMPKAVYSYGDTTTDNRHFSLQTDEYTHFTSPIRRYPDITTHRLIKSAILHNQDKTGPPQYPNREDVQMIATQCSAREKNASKAEYAMDKRLAARNMGLQIGTTYEGVATRITQNEITVTFAGHYEGTISTETIIRNGADYNFNKETMSVFNGDKKWMPYSVGDNITITIIATNEYKRTIDLYFAKKGQRNSITAPY